MPLEDPFPLQIGEKQDTWSRLQLLSNIAPEFKLIADEFNKMVKALNFLYENMGSGSGPGAGVFSMVKRSYTFGSDVTELQLTDDPLPKMVELHEESTYLPEGDNAMYTYNKATGMISFNVTMPASTNIHATKYFYDEI